MNNIITSAINKTNEDRTLEAVRAAQGLIGSIEREVKGVELTRQQIEESRKALSKIMNGELTYEKVTGGPRPANPTESQAAVIKAIEGIVKSRVSEVEDRAKSITSDIACKLEAVKATEKRIAELRVELEKVTPATITAAAIVG